MTLIIHPGLGPDNIYDADPGALAHYWRAGWRLLAEGEAPAAAAVAEPEPMTRAQAAKTAVKPAKTAEGEGKQ